MYVYQKDQVTEGWKNLRRLVVTLFTL